MALNTKIRGLQINDSFFGNGLQRNSGNNDIMEVNVDDSSIEISADALQVKASGITNDMLAGSIADGKLASDYIQTSEVDDSSIEFGASLNVKALGITNAMLAGSITDAKLDSDYVQTSEVDGTTIEFGGGTLNVVSGGIDTTQLANDAVDNTKIDLAGTYDYSSGGLKVGTPSVDADVANKSYVDSVAQGLDVKTSVVCASTSTDGNITLSGVSGQVLDDISVSADDRVLLLEQTDAKENGIWVVKSGSWVRPTDFATSDAVASAFTFVQEGTEYADLGFVCTNNTGTDVVGTHDLAFTQFSGAGQITAGNGLTKSGNTINVVGNNAGAITVNANDIAVNVDDSSIEITGTGPGSINVKASGITNDMLAGSIADGKLASDYIQTSEVDDSSIEFGASLNVKALGVTNAMLAGSITDAKLDSDYVQTSEVDGTTIEFGGGSLNIVSGGVDTTQLANEAVEVAKIAINNAEVDGYVLTWNTSGYMEWTSKTATDAVSNTDIKFENESANCNGATTDFNLGSTPIANSVQVFLNGLLQEEGSGKDYTISGTTVSFSTAPISGDILLLHYTAQ